MRHVHINKLSHKEIAYIKQNLLQILTLVCENLLALYK